ncbi:MAG: GGDEF domain-containing protein [Gemmatimonadota bacterium]
MAGNAPGRVYLGMSDIAALLRQIPLFRELDEGDLAPLAQATHSVSFGTDETIVEIGEPGHALFLITEGTVRVVYPSRTGDYELARLGPGDFFGEMALLNDKPRSATVRAVDPVQALALEKDVFRKAVRDAPRLALHLLEALSLRMRGADAQISDLSEQTLHDPLTGLLNRRAFQERVAQEVDRTHRYGRTFSLILLDLDGFKGINDTLGHDVGDEVLRWVGRLLAEHTRASDSAFRIGGEEFAVLCTDTGRETARYAAERLVGILAEAHPPLDHPLEVTMSAGYATCPVNGSDFMEIYAVADRALLTAKENGRNRVEDPW